MRASHFRDYEKVRSGTVSRSNYPCIVTCLLSSWKLSPPHTHLYKHFYMVWCEFKLLKVATRFPFVWRRYLYLCSMPLKYTVSFCMAFTVGLYTAVSRPILLSYRSSGGQA